MQLIDFIFEGRNRIDALKSLWRVYPSYSRKRTLLKLANALNQISIKKRPNEPEAFLAIDTHLLPIAADNSRSILFHKLHQKRRIYIFEELNSKTPESFTKLALSDDAANGLRHEYATLQKIGSTTSFKIPEILCYREFLGGAMLKVTAVDFDQQPMDKSAVFPKTILKEISSLRDPSLPKSLEAGTIPEWQNARSKAKIPSITKIANTINLTDTYNVSAAHRDLGSENTFCRPNSTHATDFTIIDWEYFSDTAPQMTDPVGIWLGKRHKLIKSSSTSRIEAVAERFLHDFSGTDGGQSAAVLALLHLADLGIDLAEILIGARNVDTR